jgi:hypothetical protein
MKHRVRLDAAVVAEEFAVRPFWFRVAAFVQIAFEDELSVGGHEQIIGHAFDDAHRRTAQRRDEFELVGGNAHRRADVIDGMRADGERDRQPLAALRMRNRDRAQIGRRDEVDARRAPATQHQTANADIGPAGVGIDGEIDRRRDVWRAIQIVLQMHGQRGEIAVVARQYDLLHGRFFAAHFDELAFRAQTFAHDFEQLTRRRIERFGEARTARRDAARERYRAARRLLEPHRARIAFHDAGDVGEIDGLIAPFEFRFVERSEEAAQPEAFEVGQFRALRGRRDGGLGSQCSGPYAEGDTRRAVVRNAPTARSRQDARQSRSRRLRASRARDAGTA